MAALSYLLWGDVDIIMNTKNLSGVDRGYVAYLVYMVHWLHTDIAQNQNQEAAGGPPSPPFAIMTATVSCLISTRYLWYGTGLGTRWIIMVIYVRAHIGEESKFEAAAETSWREREERWMMDRSID